MDLIVASSRRPNGESVILVNGEGEYRRPDGAGPDAPATWHPLAPGQQALTMAGLQTALAGGVSEQDIDGIMRRFASHEWSIDVVVDQQGRRSYHLARNVVFTLALTRPRVGDDLMKQVLAARGPDVWVSGAHVHGLSMTMRDFLETATGAMILLSDSGSSPHVHNPKKLGPGLAAAWNANERAVSRLREFLLGMPTSVSIEDMDVGRVVGQQGFRSTITFTFSGFRFTVQVDTKAVQGTTTWASLQSEYSVLPGEGLVATIVDNKIVVSENQQVTNQPPRNSCQHHHRAKALREKHAATATRGSTRPGPLFQLRGCSRQHLHR